MNKCKRAIYRLDSVSKSFYVYCLYYSKTPKNIRYNKNHVFYVGKAKNPTILAYRRKREQNLRSYVWKKQKEIVSSYQNNISTNKLAKNISAMVNVRYHQC